MDQNKLIYKNNHRRVVTDKIDDYDEYYELSVTVYGRYGIKRYKIPQKGLDEIISRIRQDGRECYFEEFIEAVYSALSLSDDFTDGVVISGKFRLELGGSFENGIALIATPLGTNIKMVIDENCPVLNRKEFQTEYIEILTEYIDTRKTVYTMEHSVFESVPTISFI